MLRLALAYLADFATCLAVGVAWYFLHLKPLLKRLSEAHEVVETLRGTF